MVYLRALPPPSGRDSPGVLRSGREGVWWERGDGLEVRVAAPESRRAVERSRLSLLGMLVACIVIDATPR